LTEVPELKERPQKEIAVVTVIAGKGIQTIFEDCQIDMFVQGGQSMNPSTEDILRAIESAPSDNIIVLPNNKNIILAADQAADLCEKNVVVLKSKTIPQGIAAAIAYDPEADIDTNTKRMQRAIDSIKTGSITSAVRDTKIGGTDIKLGELLGIEENTIVSNGPVLSEVYGGLMNKMIDGDSELISIYYGEGVDEVTADELRELTEKEFPQCDVELHYGGQPVYPYIISVE